jgi:polar amino acid transport system substrate-binding protein
MDVGVAKFQIAGREDKFVVLNRSSPTSSTVWAFCLATRRLRDKVQATLCRQMAADGTFARISEQWFGYECAPFGK